MLCKMLFYVVVVMLFQVQVSVTIMQVETWLSDVNDFVLDEADDMSYSVRIAALNLIMVSVCSVAMATHVM